jgi:hypothetical protein
MGQEMKNGKCVATSTKSSESKPMAAKSMSDSSKK